MFKDEAHALCCCLSQGVFIQRMGICFKSYSAVGDDFIFHIHVTEELLVGDIVIAVADVPVDYKLVDGLQLDLGFVFCVSVAFVPDVNAHGEDVSEFAYP